jgi:hypothetical protein
MGLAYVLMPHILQDELAYRLVPYVMLAAGLLLLVATGLVANRYKDTLDYEPARLLGRETDGKSIRSIARAGGTLGCLFVIIGGSVAFLMLVMAGG